MQQPLHAGPLAQAASALERWREMLQEDPDNEPARKGLEGLLTDEDLRLTAADVLEPVYEGQIVGENARDKDMTVNVTRLKALTNMRSAGADKTVPLKPPVEYGLEAALEYIEDDELVEVTPSAVRMRKLLLKEGDRKKFERSKA